MYVAIVFKQHDDTGIDSHRETGGWESFLGATRGEAIAKAMLWKQRWELTPNILRGKYYGPYDILVGVVKEKVDLAPNFELVTL